MGDLDENIELLRTISPDASDERIRAALKKHPNDLNAAINALLDQADLSTSNDDTFIGPLLGPLEAPLPEDEQFTRGRGALNAGGTRLNNSPIQIDLTQPSREASPAGKAGTSSLDTSQEKANWAVVHQPQASSGGGVVYGPHLPPNHPQYTRTQQQQDDDLHLAMAESLRSSMLDAGGNTPFVELSLLQKIRPHPDFPVTVRSRSEALLHVGPLIQALYAIPQVRDAFKGVSFRRHAIHKSYIGPFWKAMSRMEMGIQGDVLIEDVIPRQIQNPENQGLVDSKSMAEEMYKEFTSEAISIPDLFPHSLFYSRIWYPPSTSLSSEGQRWNNDTNPYSSETDTAANLPMIPINANINSPDNDLLTYLHEHTWSRKLERAGEVLVFGVSQEEGPVPMSASLNASSASGSKGTTGGANASTSKGSGPNRKHILRYPARIHVDPFLLENTEVSAQQRRLRQYFEDDIQESEAQLSFLGAGSNKAPLRNMRATIKYFEELAPAARSEEEEEKRQDTIETLKTTLEAIERKIEEHKYKVKGLRISVSQIFDVPGLQKVPYDLRSVLMNDGMFGRTHLYAYVKADDGKWYKSVESTMTEVTEESVLNDSTGLHLGAGPFMLFYSKSDKPSDPRWGFVDPDLLVQDSSATNEQASTATAEPSGATQPPKDQEIDETFQKRKEEFSKWNIEVRRELRDLNEQFRRALEEEGIVDVVGKILRSTDAEGKEGVKTIQERYLWADPLATWDDDDLEEAMEYDSDAHEIRGEDDMGTGKDSGMAVADDDEILPQPWTKAPLPQPGNIQPYDPPHLGTSSPTIPALAEDEPLNWTQQTARAKTWDESNTVWDNDDVPVKVEESNAGWGPAATATVPIEVEVTQTVETKHAEEETEFDDK